MHKFVRVKTLLASRSPQLCSNASNRATCCSPCSSRYTDAWKELSRESVLRSGETGGPDMAETDDPFRFSASGELVTFRTVLVPITSQAIWQSTDRFDHSLHKTYVHGRCFQTAVCWDLANFPIMHKSSEWR